ncbi:hypothetical protein Hanom_Chr13g01228721 [Helianthus anomalus]
MKQVDIPVEFPVVLYNGERQISVGNIEIHPTIDFQKFRTMLKQMIGISYNNLTTYLVESRRSDNVQPERRKILITSKVDFLVLIREKNAYFLVVLKRSRRDRRRKTNNRNCVELSPADLFDYRYDHHDVTTTTQVSESGKVEFWLHELQMQRENHMNYLMMHNVDDDDDDCANFPSVTEAYQTVERSITEAYSTVERSENRALCEECAQADKEGLKPQFHLCVYDDVVEGFFRSPAGPVCRPE